MTDAIAVLVWLTFDAACVFWAIRGYVAWLDWRDAKQAARIAAEEAQKARNAFESRRVDMCFKMWCEPSLTVSVTPPAKAPSPHPLKHPCFSSSRSLVELFAGEREGGEA